MSLEVISGATSTAVRNNNTDVLSLRDDAGMLTLRQILARKNLIVPGGSNVNNGAVNVSGLVVPKANIQFPATNFPSADPNVLDDYEEGTWTPSAGFAPGVFSVQQANYRRVGSLVYLSCVVTFADQPSLTGTQAVIVGIPFPLRVSSIGCLNIGYNSAPAAMVDGLGRTWQQVTHAMVYGGDQIALYLNGNFAYHGPNANAQLYMSGHYLTN